MYAAFGTETPARAQAYIVDTDVSSAGDVVVNAESSATMNAVVSNDTSANASAFYGASASTSSGVLSMNKVSSLAKAYIDFNGAQGTIGAGGLVNVTSVDNATMDAATSMGNSFKRTNDLGLGLINDFVSNLKDEYQYTDASGMQLSLIHI